MHTFDFSVYLVVYNFVIGLLLMLSSEKFGTYAGCLIKPFREKTARLTRVVTFTFGMCVAVLSGVVYIFFHLLRIGV